MGTRRVHFLLPLAATAALLGCGAEISSGKKDAGAHFDAGSSGSAGRGAGGSAGASLGGSGGSVGSGGSTGSGGSSSGGSSGAPGRDGGMPMPDARPDTAPPACLVTIQAVSPQKLLDLPPGRTTTLRLRATVGGARPPAMPTWRWTIVHESNTGITPMRVGASTAREDMVEFPLVQPGRYDIRVEAAPSCFATEVATAFDPTGRPTPYWARVLPPPGSRATALETTIQLLPGQTIPHTLTLAAGRRLAIDPMRADMQAESSYIRVTSAQSSVRLEGRNGGAAGSFRVVLNPLLRYDVLILPDGVFAPILIRNELPERLSALAFRVDGGVMVGGMLTREGGGAVDGAKVLLRSGDLPSSTGASVAGAYRLSARAGTYGVVVAPPLASGLPQALLTQEDGVAVGTAAVGMDLRWDALAATPVRLTVRASDGAVPGRPVRVRLESAPDALTQVGTFTLDGRTIGARGVMRVEATTDAAGLATFASLPRARYLATLAPSDTLSVDGVTTVPLDLSVGTGTHVLALVPRVRVSGRLVPAARAAGATVVAMDIGADAPDALISQRADAAGSYALDLAPGRTYRLFVEPQPERAVPRVPLGAVTVGPRDAAVDDRTLPVGLAIDGTVVLEGSAVAGALVQLFCVGEGPECVNREAPSVELVRPLSETTADAAGAFRLVVPDPGSPP